MWMSVWIAIGAVTLAALGFAVWVRMAPVEAERWHVDPTTAPSPGGRGWLAQGGADLDQPRTQASAGEMLARLDTAAAETPRTRRIAGSVAEGRITYETRSRVWGFPDYTTVAVVERDGRAAPVILGRARFGRSDFGVNRTRIERWLAALERPAGAIR